MDAVGAEGAAWVCSSAPRCQIAAPRRAETLPRLRYWLQEPGSVIQQCQNKLRTHSLAQPQRLALSPEVSWQTAYPSASQPATAVRSLFWRTPEVSDRRRQKRWSARGASELPPHVERKSGAAVRWTDFVGRFSRSHLVMTLMTLTALNQTIAQTMMMTNLESAMAGFAAAHVRPQSPSELLSIYRASLRVDVERSPNLVAVVTIRGL